MKLTLFDLYPNLSDLHWCADEAALILLYGTDTAGKDDQLIFRLTAELNTLAVRGDIEHQPYSEEDARQMAERGEFPPLRLKATSVLEWALSYPDMVEVCDETKSWYSTKRQGKQKPKTGQPGPRDETLYRLIAAMARALEYTPGQGGKSGQSKLKMIKNHTALDEKTIRKHIVDALNKFPNDGE
jgi:hypothetical protein